MTTIRAQPASDVVPVSLGTRVAYGSSAFAENLAINSINQLANAVFNSTLGVPLLHVGLALSLPRLIDVFLDLFIGNWSDRLRSRWGRRRPFILVGAGLCAVAARRVRRDVCRLQHPHRAGGTVALAIAAAYFIFRYAVTPGKVAQAQARGPVR